MISTSVVYFKFIYSITRTNTLSTPTMLLSVFAAAFTASALASDNTYLVASQPRCSSTTSNSLLIEWDADSTSDLFYIAFSKSSNDRPFALKTSASNSVTVDDLMPSTTYHIQLRSHPASEPTIAWVSVLFSNVIPFFSSLFCVCVCLSLSLSLFYSLSSVCVHAFPAPRASATPATDFTMVVE